MPAEGLSSVIPLLAGPLFMVLFIGERLWPLRASSTGFLHRRLGVNAVTVGLAPGTAAIAVAPTVDTFIRWGNSQRIGLLRLVELPAPVVLVAGVLLMDLSFYYWHRLNHVVPILWRFRNAHHIDPDLDSATAFRFHAVEIAYSAGFRAVQQAVIGPSLSVYLVYEALFLSGSVNIADGPGVPIVRK